MNLLTIVTLLVALCAAFSYLNIKLFRLPGTIGVMTISVITSIVILVIGRFFTGFISLIEEMTKNIDFSSILLDVLLGFLLFASALHFDFEKLRKQRRPVLIFSTIGVAISTAIIGGLLYLTTGWIGLHMPFIYCLVFGALISPTDPIAVGAILKKSHMPEKLNVILSGESMLNDAAGLVLFLTLLNFADPNETNRTFQDIVILFVQEVVGGVALGLAGGFLIFKMMQSIRDFQTIVLLSAALVLGLCLLAPKIHASAPLAAVCAGLLIGNKDFGEDHPAQTYMVDFWRLIDEMLNTVVFVLMGLQLVILPTLSNYLLLGIIAITITLIARASSITLPAFALGRRITTGNIAILTWAGLRGGISIAMALSLPANQFREPILSATYICVIFSVLVQGLTLNKVINSAIRKPGPSISTS
jgi:CPA1 family monovalent cation:H+ antiporter